jgi:hypothetical protein
LEERFIPNMPLHIKAVTDTALNNRAKKINFPLLHLIRMILGDSTPIK